MKILNLGALYVMTLAASGIPGSTYATEKQLTVGGKNLTLAAPPTCASAQPSRKELAKYLVQYDPSGEPNEDITDETPWTHEEIETARRALVLYGFQYPNGQVSVITWTDFDGDGVCDFSASAGIRGAKSIDRHFLFRGLPGGGFRLVDSDYSYKSTSVTILPHIPIRVAGETLPLLVKEDNILQWQAERKRFVTCDMIQSGPEALKLRAAFSLLAQLCINPSGMFDWAADQLPHKNELPHWTPAA